MTADEAKRILRTKLQQLRSWDYSDLVAAFNKSQATEEVIGESGQRFQVEAQAFIEDKRHGHLRVTVSVDDGGIRAFAPRTASFIMAPDGSFLEE